MALERLKRWIGQQEEEQSPFEEQPPFIETLKDTDLSTRIKNLRRHPEKLVREISVDAALDFLGKGNIEGVRLDQVPEYQKRNLLIDGLRHWKETLETLQRYPGIHVPALSFILGRNAGEMKLYTVIERIEGESISRSKKLPPESQQPLDVFYASMAQYYYDRYRKEEPFWWDFSQDQIVYGRRPEEDERKLYIVDVDPTLINPETHTSLQLKSGSLTELTDLSWDIRNTEKKFNPPIKLEQAREKLKETLDMIPEDDPSYEAIEAARSKLES